MAGGSEKQFKDALRVYEVLDLAYLESWVKQLEIETFWERLKAEAEMI